jgi:hypothetical protein
MANSKREETNKMRSVTTFAAVLVSALAVAASATASRPTTGTQIPLLNPAATPATFRASTPFFVRQGWACLPEELGNCLDSGFRFRLYIDGARMRTRLDLQLHLACPAGVTPAGECSSRLYLRNVRLGLPAGPHTFRAEWWQDGEPTIVREATIDFVG